MAMDTYGALRSMRHGGSNASVMGEETRVDDTEERRGGRRMPSGHTWMERTAFRRHPTFASAHGVDVVRFHTRGRESQDHRRHFLSRVGTCTHSSPLSPVDRVLFHAIWFVHGWTNHR